MMRTPVREASAIVLALAVGGCATQADLLQQDRKLSGMIEEQSRSIDAIRRELQRLREDMGARGSRAPGRVPVAKGARTPPTEKEASPDRLAPSEEIGMTMSPDAVSSDESAPPSGPVVAAPPPSADAPVEAAAARPATPPASPPPPAAGAVDEDWKREVAQDRAVASATAAPERTEYIKSLDGLEQGDCAKAVPGLKQVSAGAKGSPLSDNAIYWQARCLAARGDQHKAVSRLGEVVAHYPKSDKAPAALWAQGQLQLGGGDVAAARGTFGRLIRDYPASVEAGRARRKLAEMAN
jgi:TolA-binding protein